MRFELRWERIESESVGLCIAQGTARDMRINAFHNAMRVLQPGRRLVVVVHPFDDVSDNSSAACVSCANLAGFTTRHHIIWRNPTAGERWLIGKSFPHGPSVVVNQNFADIWVFQKPEPPRTNHHAKYVALREDLLVYDVMDNEFRERFAKNAIWECADLREGDDGYPDVPLEILYPLIRMWSRPGETVLDLGTATGQVALAAMQWKRDPLVLTGELGKGQRVMRRLEADWTRQLNQNLLGNARSS